MPIALETWFSGTIGVGICSNPLKIVSFQDVHVQIAKEMCVELPRLLT